MKRTTKEALLRRRSYYALTAATPIPDEEIAEIVRFVVTHTPSAFNSQSTRLVLLLHEEHSRLWQLVKDTLQAIVPAESFAHTADKIDTSFAAGYGTVLFFEDQEVVQGLQRDFPLYADRFPVWAQHTSAMHQLSIWTLLEEAGFGASLQHYNPLVDQKIHESWELPASWELIAQMPFGTPAAAPAEKTFEPLDGRIRIFG